MTRIRKAYHYRADLDHTCTGTIYAPSAAAARSDLYRRLADCWSLTFREFLEMRIFWTRRPSEDITLPDRHPLTADLAPDDLHVVTHAFGGTWPKAGWRDHFFTSADDPQLTRLTALGLFVRGPILDSRIYPSGSAYFTLTSLGRAVAAGEQALYEPWVEALHRKRLERQAAKRQAKAA